MRLIGPVIALWLILMQGGVVIARGKVEELRHSSAAFRALLGAQ